MVEIQLEFNMENKTSEEMQLFIMQKQIDLMTESMGKVRRKLFSEMGEMRKLYAELQKENAELKTMLKEIKNEKTEWNYRQNGFLFDIQQPQRAVV
jgi:SNF2 family DNA or RNA helicase